VTRVNASALGGDKRLCFDRAPGGERPQKQSVGELDAPEAGLVAHDVIVVDPADTSLHERPRLVEWRADVHGRLPQATPELLLEERDDLVASAQQRTRLDRDQAENCIGGEELPELRKRLEPEDGEIPPHQAVDVRRVRVSGPGDGPEYSSVPAAAREPAERDESDERDDDADPEVPDDREHDADDHEDPSERDTEHPVPPFREFAVHTPLDGFGRGVFPTRQRPKRVRVNRDRPIDEDARVRRLPAVTLAVVAVWTAGALWLDQHLGRTGQLGLGVFTACVLATLLAFQPRSVRLQTLAVVLIATCGEVIGSIVWGVYTYRLENLPTFVPPGHGLMYLAGMSLATLVARRPTALVAFAILGATSWAVLGLTVMPATDVSGAIGATFLVLVLLKTRRTVYAGVFVVVALLEIYGTAVGTWTWHGVVPGLGIPQGNPPSGAASGYVVFDVLALALVARLGAVTGALQSRKARRASGATFAPATMSSRASSTLPHTSQSSAPLAAPSSST
jgi:hypothetical protein